jgi:hypothetical protein
MKTVIIEYAKIAPTTLELIVKGAFPKSLCAWKDLGEDFFEFTVYCVTDLEMLEDVLAEWM